MPKMTLMPPLAAIPAAITAVTPAALNGRFGPIIKLSFRPHSGHAADRIPRRQ